MYIIEVLTFYPSVALLLYSSSRSVRGSSNCGNDNRYTMNECESIIVADDSIEDNYNHNIRIISNVLSVVRLYDTPPETILQLC